jgi:threonylcarbamoyladenosine tRNA methylthiotransferase MtaB
VEWLASRLPVFGLGADIMVGFPGETDADHRATVDLVEALPFTYLHVFPYSERPGTAARRLGRPVAEPGVARRSAELREIGSRKTAAYEAARAGQRGDVVVSGRSRGHYQGVTEDYLTVGMTTGEVVAPRFDATLRVVDRRLTA